MLELGGHQANCFTAIVQLLGLRKSRPHTKAPTAVAAEVPDAASPFYMPLLRERTTPSAIVRGQNCCRDNILDASYGACRLDGMHVSSTRTPPQSCLKFGKEDQIDIRSVSTDASLPSPRFLHLWDRLLLLPRTQHDVSISSQQSMLLNSIPLRPSVPIRIPSVVLLVCPLRSVLGPLEGRI